MVYEADITLPNSGATGASRGLVFKANNINGAEFNGYVATLDSNMNNQRLWLYKYVAGGSPIILGSAGLASVYSNYTYHIKAECDGSTIKVYLDNMQVPKITLNDTSYTSGAIGLLSNNANIKFDNVCATNTAAFLTSTYTYLRGPNDSLTNSVGTFTCNGNIFSYTYDANNNIQSITDSNYRVIKYYYNELNEVIREDNQVLNKTITYQYDVGGNLLNKKEYVYTTGTPSTLLSNISYAYDVTWKDKMTSYNGKSITYDAIGNPLTYDGWTYTWEMGRQLASANAAGQNLSFKYNDAEIRTQKTVNGVTTKYHLVGDRVTYETNGSDQIYYTYDANNELISMKLNGTEYYYAGNGQGDIIGLVDSNGIQVVSYTYDTWGKLVSTTGSLASTVGVKNPYRYRGYRYDTETGLYYLQSRYYNPEWGRFINADAIMGQQGKLLSHNLFAYCYNNPATMEDSSGYVAQYNETGISLGPATGLTFPKFNLGRFFKTLFTTIGAGMAANNPFVVYYNYEYTDAKGKVQTLTLEEEPGSGIWFCVLNGTGGYTKLVEISYFEATLVMQTNVSGIGIWARSQTVVYSITLVAGNNKEPRLDLDHGPKHYHAPFMPAHGWFSVYDLPMRN